MDKHIPERWLWISEWCKKNGLTPHDHNVWKQGEEAYERRNDTLAHLPWSKPERPEVTQVKAQRDRLAEALRRVRAENHWTTVHEIIDNALKQYDKESNQ